jgi:probable rRNA maturation factor
MTEDELPPDISLVVAVTNLQGLKVDVVRVHDVARKAAGSEDAIGELSVVLVDAEQMAEMNSQYRDECGPTDVLSFSIDGLISGGVGSDEAAPFVIGEVVVCPEVAKKQSDDLEAELDLLVTHGVLHLLGFDHADESSAAAMRQKENELIGRSGASAT